MNIACPYCHSSLEVSDELTVGENVSCTACQKSFACPPAYDLSSYNEKVTFVPLDSVSEEENLPKGHEEENATAEQKQRINKKRERERNRRIAAKIKEAEQLSTAGYLIFILKVLAIILLVVGVFLFLGSFIFSSSIKMAGVVCIASAFNFWIILSVLQLLVIIAKRLAVREEKEE